MLLRSSSSTVQTPTAPHTMVLWGCNGVDVALFQLFPWATAESRSRRFQSATAFSTCFSCWGSKEVHRACLSECHPCTAFLHVMHQNTFCCRLTNNGHTAPAQEHTGVCVTHMEFLPALLQLSMATHRVAVPPQDHMCTLSSQ